MLSDVSSVMLATPAGRAEEPLQEERIRVF